MEHNGAAIVIAPEYLMRRLETALSSSTMQLSVKTRLVLVNVLNLAAYCTTTNKAR